MKKIIIPFLFILAACNNSTKTAEEKTKQNEPLPKETSTAVAVNSPLLGSYVGAFGTNKITLLITKVLGDSVEGRSVVGGNDRPFVGTAKVANGLVNIMAKEPGDDKYDGSFILNFDNAKPDNVTGSWTPFKEGSHGGAKTFSLNRNAFKYLTDVGMFPQSSKRLLTEEEVANFSKTDLELMRNEIFARHGYCFKKKELREQFEDKDWYIPNNVDVKDALTSIEKKNIALIKNYEKYATEMGDDFGR